MIVGDRLPGAIFDTASRFSPLTLYLHSINFCESKYIKVSEIDLSRRKHSPIQPFIRDRIVLTNCGFVGCFDCMRIAELCTTVDMALSPAPLIVSPDSAMRWSPMSYNKRFTLNGMARYLTYPLNQQFHLLPPARKPLRHFHQRI